jgi:CRISPR/Cas system-associated exonuclease Cas4 (RecB family)
MQVAAHALLVREHGVNAVRGAIYYAADKRRVPVELLAAAVTANAAIVRRFKSVKIPILFII